MRGYINSFGGERVVAVKIREVAVGVGAARMF